MNKNIYLGIITHKNNLHKHKSLIKYYSKSGYEFNFFLGKNDSINVNLPYILVNVEDSYISIKYKVIKMIEHALNSAKRFDYIAKVDDDTYLDLDVLSKLDFKGRDYIGIITSFNKHKKRLKNSEKYYKLKTKNSQITFNSYTGYNRNFKYAVGGCYFLSRQIAVKIVESFKKNVCPFYQEDVTIGYHCNLNNAAILNLGKNKNYKFFDISKDGLIIHPVNYLLFNKLHKIDNFSEKMSILQKFIPLNPYYNNALI